MKNHRKSNARGARRATTPAFPDDYLPYLVARASHVVLRDFHALLPRGMRVPEWRVLGTLSRGGGYTVGALARATLFKQPTLSKVLDRLERRGLVRRAGGGMDLRQSMVELTGKGRKRIRPVVAAARRREKTFLRDFRAADVKALKRLLKGLADRLEEKGR